MFRSQLLELVDSDSDDGFNGGLTTALARPSAKGTKSTNINNNKMAPAKKGKGAAARGRQAASSTVTNNNKVTKPAPKNKKKTSATRAVSGRIAAAASQQFDEEEDEEDEEESRTTLIDKSTNVQPKKAPAPRGRKRAAPVEDEDEEDIDMADSPKQHAAKSTRGRPKKTARGNVEAEEVHDSQPPPPPQPTRGGRGRKAVAKVEPVVEEEEEEEGEMEDAEMEGETTEIPETQPQKLVPEDEDEEQEDEELGDLPTRHSSSDPPRGGRKAAPQAAPSPAKRRAMQAETSDPALRRRLGEMTQKYESLEQKYQNLREVAVREADSNFDKLRRQMDEKSKTADELIASLKAELAAQREASKDAARLRKQLEASESQAATLQASVAQLTTSLTESKTEIKSLGIKLTAARTAEAAAAAKASTMHHHHQVPGSAIKGSSSRNMMMSSNNSAEAVRQATANSQKREDLYADLTGLIIRTVPSSSSGSMATTVATSDEHVMYDCIQTGRNGTLHFKLLEVGVDEGDEDIDEPQLRYMPQLDPDRDRGLLEILPSFLAEEIEFPRSHVDKFYARVIKALTGA